MSDSTLLVKGDDGLIYEVVEAKVVTPESIDRDINHHQNRINELNSLRSEVVNLSNGGQAQPAPAPSDAPAQPAPSTTDTTGSAPAPTTGDSSAPAPSTTGSAGDAPAVPAPSDQTPPISA